MLKKIYQELVEVKMELKNLNKKLRPSKDFALIREPYSTRYTVVKAGCKYSPEEPMEWRRFELLTESAAERERLERLLSEYNLSRRDLAIILFGLRVRPEFGKEDFGI